MYKMSDVFKNIDYGNQAQSLLTKVQSAETKVAAQKAKKDARGNIEKNVGLLKTSLGGQKVFAGVLKGAKPYLKQQGQKALNSLKNKTEDIAERVAPKSQELQDAEKARDELKETQESNEEDRLASEADANENVENAAASALKDGNDAFEATSDAVKGQVETMATNDAARAGEASDLSDANEAVAAAQQNSAVASSVSSKVATNATKTAAEDAGKTLAKEGGEDAAVEGGEIAAEVTGTEALGAVFDAIPGGQVIGILIGALGIGLGARAESEKRAPQMKPMQLNQGGSSFQAGVSQ